MASLTSIYWRDIPAQVIVKRGRETAKAQLSARFQQAIDRAAMRAGQRHSDAYLAEWRRDRSRRLAATIFTRRPQPRRPAEALDSDEDLERLVRSKGVAEPGVDSRAAAFRLSASDVSHAPLVGASCARPQIASTHASSRVLVGLDPLWRPSAIGGWTARWPPSRAPSRACCSTARCAGSACSSSTGMSCPMNCPEEPAQRPLRRRARRRQLRGHAGDALRLGGGIGGQPADSRRRPKPCAMLQPPVDRRLQGQLVLAARRARADRSRHGNSTTSRFPATRCRSCRGTSRPAASSACCARAVSRSPRSWPRRTRPIPTKSIRRARVFDGYVDAINAIDGSGANCHMSSIGVCALLTRAGYAPIMQISCRDRNRIAIQGDILGGAAMGVANMLCLTGDGVQAGDHPQAKPVFDLDSISPARDRHARCATSTVSRAAARSPTRRGCFSAPPRTRSSPPLEWRPLRLAKKIAAGAQFIQTQYCFDIPRLRQFMNAGGRAGTASTGLSS